MEEEKKRTPAVQSISFLPQSSAESLSHAAEHSTTQHNTTARRASTARKEGDIVRKMVKIKEKQ